MRQFVVFLLLSGPCVVAAQTTSPPVPSPTENSPALTIQITVNLVQVDAVVTDSKNHPVTNLQAKDFEILQDGVPQVITNFSYIREAAPDTGQRPTSLTKNAVAPPPRELKPQEIRRVVALVVDDLGLSFESTACVHIALKKFVDEQMLPGDLVAILRTGGGIGTLQQFTSDKRLLYAAIDRVKFNAQGRVGISSFEPLLTLNTPGGPGSVTPIAAVGGTGMGHAEAARDIDVTYLAGSLGAIRYVVQGLKELPGRKSLILFSENMPMSSHPDVIDSLHRLTDAAERASVVIYAIDPRGLAVLQLTAADQTAGLSPAALTSAAMQRTQGYLGSQDGMSFLARETGGLFIHDLNDIPGSVRQVLEDSSGYYLIGYRPAAGTFDPVTGRRKFHHVRVRVKRTGLFVRTRGGFFGLSDRESAPVLTTRESQISHALASPFSAPDIHLRLTAIFSNQSKGSFVTTFLHTDARDIAFTHDPDGSYKGTVDLIAALFGDNGQVVASGDFTYTLRVKDEDYDSVLRNGFIFRERHLIKQPGAYQIRLVMRDATTQTLGSASQYLDVPDVKKGHLAVSGILLSQSSDLAASTGALANNQTQAFDAKGNAAVRIFRPGAKIAYVYEVLNTQHPPGNPPQVLEQVRLFRDGQQFYANSATPLDFHGQTDLPHLTAGGLIRLGPQFAPGDYAMQVIVTDKLAKKEKYRSVSQWMNFEVE
jgi:VWFA-related protein